jgi:hypothetical protein
MIALLILEIVQYHYHNNEFMVANMGGSLFSTKQSGYKGARSVHRGYFGKFFSISAANYAEFLLSSSVEMMVQSGHTRDYKDKC